MSAAEQLDLTSLIEATPREEWEARFARGPWKPLHAAHDPRCTGRIGWVCPACKQVELNGFLLNLNHGYDPGIPGHMAGPVETFGQSCTRLDALARQERLRKDREKKARTRT